MLGLLTRDERIVVLFLAVAVAVGSAVVGVGRVDPSRAEKAVAETSQAPGADGGSAALRVDLNSADGPELERLPGIGPAKAQAILEHREQRGRFRSVDELDAVKGIGPATLERLRPFAAVCGESLDGAELRESCGTAEDRESD